MQSSNKKYVSISDASAVSGYSVKELRNFVKIGLIPSRKVKGKVCVRLDAFSDLNRHRQPSAASSSKQQARPIGPTALRERPVMSLVPFTTPHPALTKILEPVAFTATLVMVLYLTMIPGVSEAIVGSAGTSLDISQRTVAQFGQSAYELIDTSVSLPQRAIAALMPEQIDASTYQSIVYVTTSAGEGRVAGIADLRAAVTRPALVVESEVVTFGNTIDAMMVGIADASDSALRFLDGLSDKTMETLVGNLTFDKVDAAVSQSFRW